MKLSNIGEITIIDDIEILLTSFTCKIDVLILTETWLNDNENWFTNLKDFVAYHCNRSSGNYGGFGIFVRKSLDSSLVFLDKFDDSSVIGIKIHSYNINIFGIYKPPHSVFERFIEKLNVITEIF